MPTGVQEIYYLEYLENLRKYIEQLCKENTEEEIETQNSILSSFKRMKNRN